LLKKITVTSTATLNFESALQNIAKVLSKELYKYRLPRVMRVSHQIKRSLELQIKDIEENLAHSLRHDTEQFERAEVIAKKHHLSRLTEALTTMSI
jgi:hypothetical protein